MPLSNVSARNAYKSGKATLQQLVLKLKQLEQNVMVEIDNAVKQAQSAWKAWTPRGRRAFMPRPRSTPSRKNTPLAKAPPSPCCNSRTRSPPTAPQEIRALANYNEALANLAPQEGSTLERQKIDLKAN